MERHRAAREAELACDPAFAEKVRATFLVDGRLVAIPARLKKQRVVLEHLAGLFDPDRSYHELEVNAVLGAVHDDVATLRRLLVTEKQLERENGIYRRVVA